MGLFPPGPLPDDGNPRAPLSARPTLRFLNTLTRGALMVVRLILIWSLLHGLTPPPPRVTLGPPQTVQTLHPEVCVHTLLQDEVEEWKIQRNMIMVREMGAPTIVEFFPWAYAEQNRGSYSWVRFDQTIRQAHNQGLTIIARLGLVPAWARPPTQEKVTTPNYLPYDEFDHFADFVGAFVARYREEVSTIIIWNEPNLSGEWGGRQVDPEAYTELLRVSYQAAHRANPDIIVLGGALAPTLEPEGGSGGMNDIRYLERMYEAGAAPYFDALAAHTYGQKNPPQDDPAPDVINFRRVELLRAVMVLHGDSSKPVYITESGWSDDPLWDKAVRPGQRIEYTLEAFQMVEGWSWARTLCLWDFRQPVDRTNRREAYYALVSSDFIRRPIYEAVQAYARGWKNPYQP